MLDNDISIKGNAPLNDSKINKTNIKPEQVQQFDGIDPAKVTRPSKQDKGSGTGQNRLGYNPGSVFDKFIQTLQSAPVLSESGSKLLINRQFVNHNIKNDPVLGALFENFLKNIEMNEAEILDFLKFQQNTYTKFHGDFFSSLRNLLSKNQNNEDFKIVLRNFLKSYDCFISVEETYSSIYSALNSIKNSMPNMLKEPFNSLIGKMIADSGKNSCDVNLGVLKNEIIPFIGRYISRMNDFGPVRDYVSVLVHNIVRLESSSRENFSTDLENLFDFIKFNLNVGDDELGRIKESLIENYENTSSIKNESVDSFLKLIKTGMKNSENIVSKGMMEDITKSLLICEDVHIPMTHMFLPLCCNGMFMFSELWVNKDFVEEGSNKSGYTRKPAFKVFITFDIQNVGYFETILIMKGSKITLEIFVPSSLKSCEKSIRNGIGDILGKNSISFSEIHISECSRKRKFSEIFSNIKERESGIDVII